MHPRPRPRTFEPHNEPSLRMRRSVGPSGTDAAYAAFCREHRPVYERFAAAVTGSASAGRDVGRAALEELGDRWLAALRSSSPATYAWTILADSLAPHRTAIVRALYADLRRPQEADALILRHRLGYSAAVAGHAMGLSSDAFELLRRTALTNVAHTCAGRHMPRSDAA
jgi:DNA-directed RNA polymerase specialized sigma24 family protein